MSTIKTGAIFKAKDGSGFFIVTKSTKVGYYTITVRTDGTRGEGYVLYSQLSDYDQMFVATNRLINSVWTLVYEVVEGGVRIISHDRDNEDGYILEGKVEQFRLNEDESRTVLSVVFAPAEPFGFTPSRELEVVNPAHVFDYGA